jgi:putative peptidoglycan lipid II flippase
MFSRTCSMFHGRENTTVGGAALVIALFGVASRLLGFVRDRILAGTFGAGDVLDAYYAAFRIPDFLYGLLVAGALSAAFVPVFTELREKNGGRSAWDLASGVFVLVVCVLGGTALLAFVFAEPVMSFVVSGFSSEKQELSTNLMRIMLIGPVFLGMSAVFGSVLVSFRNFIVFSLAPLFYNVGIILGAVLFSRFFGPSGLAIGVVLGTALHALVQYPSVRRAGFRISFGAFSCANREVWRVIRLMVPRSLGIAVGQVSFLVVTMFASFLAPGTLAAFTLANNIQSVPLGLFGVAFSLAAFPALSGFVAKDDRRRFLEILIKTSRQVLFFVLPASLMIIALRAQIVRVILGTGAFDWEDTTLTFEILGILSASLFAQSLIPLFARAFFSLQDTKTPLFLALFSEVIHIAVLVVYIEAWGPLSLALSFSVASIVNALLLFFFLRKRVGVWSDRSFFTAVSKMVLASLCALLAVQSVKFFFGLGNVELDTFVEVFLELVLAGLFGIAAFIASAWILKIEELEQVWRFIVSRVLKQPQVLKEAEEESSRGVV